MNIQDYPVNFGYLETTTLNGRPYTHRGLDFPLRYEPVRIQGTQIGVSGNSGLSTAPHCHVQAGRDEWAQQTLNPTPYVGKPGAVVKTGHGSQWGNYICIRVGDVNVFYCHLSQINVNVGQQIKEEDMRIPDQDNYYARYGQDLATKIRGRQLSRDEFRRYLVGQTDLRAIEILSDDPEAATVQHWQNIGRVAVQDKWDQQIYGLQDTVKKLQAGESVTDDEIKDLLADMDKLRQKIAKVKE